MNTFFLKYLFNIFRWISQHLAKEEQEKLESVLEASDSSIEINYSKYNWDLNGSKL